MDEPKLNFGVFVLSYIHFCDIKKTQFSLNYCLRFRDLKPTDICSGYVLHNIKNTFLDFQKKAKKSHLTMSEPDEVNYVIDQIPDKHQILRKPAILHIFLSFLHGM